MQARALSIAVLAAVCAGCIVHVDTGGSSSWSDGYDYSAGKKGSHRITGNGVQASETREVASFDAVELSGSFDIDIEVGGIDVGAGPSVTVHGDENLLSHVVTEVENSVLEVYMEGAVYSSEQRLHVEVRVPDLRSFVLSGSGDARIVGVDRHDFALSLSGSGEIQAGGRAEFMSVWLSGSGDFDLRDLQVREADVQISGSGDVKVSTSNRLDARVSGSGDVLYLGSPSTNTRVSGSGSIRRGSR